MKNVRQLLREEKGEKAHRQAVEMGLKYKGFGYWVDPSTGEVAYKTENDQLVPVDPDVESEKAGKDGPEAGGAPSGGFGNDAGGMGAGFGTFMNKQNPMGMGVNVQGVADNGLAQAPNTDNGRWEPGKDGDNYTTQDKILDNDLPKDTFVGKTNTLNWTAGKDGDNYTTLTVQDMFQKAIGMNAVNEAEDMGHKTMFQKMIGMKDPSANDPSHVAKAAQVYQQQGDTGKGEMMRNVIARGNDTQNMAIQMDRLPSRMERRKKRQGAVKQLNDNFRMMAQDPDYDMSQKGEELGSGMFGSVYESADGKNVIKEGKLSAKEIAILHKLRDVKAFPNLINAKVTSPFESADEIFGSGTDTENEEMGDGMAYFNSMPFADGQIAMQKLSGRPYSHAEDELTEEQKEKFIQKLWAARSAMHRLGISHNDMHGENFFIDDAGNPGILDLGLANDDPLSALMEGLGGVSGEDYQLDTDAKVGGGPLASLMGGGFNFVPEALKERIKGNVSKVRDQLVEKMMDYTDLPEDPDDEYYDIQMKEIADRVEKIMPGGLRLDGEALANMREELPFLEDNDTVLELINSLYDNVADTETGQRMTNAFDKLQQDRRTVAAANAVRRRKGQPEIEDRIANRKVLDPDD